MNGDEVGKAFILLSAGKNVFFIEKVKFTNLSTLKEFRKTKALTIEKLIEELKLLSKSKIIIHRTIFENYNNLMSDFIDKSNQLIIFEENMASIIGKNTLPNNGSDNI